MVDVALYHRLNSTMLKSISIHFAFVRQIDDKTKTHFSNLANKLYLSHSTTASSSCLSCPLNSHAKNFYSYQRRNNTESFYNTMQLTNLDL